MIWDEILLLLLSTPWDILQEDIENVINNKIRFRTVDKFQRTESIMLLIKDIWLLQNSWVIYIEAINEQFTHVKEV